jgi:hypothetical protein
MSNPSPVEVAADLRKTALTEFPKRMAENPAFKNESALGVLMETGYEKAVATLVAWIDGSASVYFSSGGGIIGGAGHAEVRIAAKRFAQFVGIHISEMSVCSDYPLPKVGQTTFYAISANGVFTITAPEQELGNGAHSFSPLFHAGHYLLTRLRMTVEKRQNTSLK